MRIILLGVFAFCLAACGAVGRTEPPTLQECSAVMNAALLAQQMAMAAPASAAPASVASVAAPTEAPKSPTSAAPVTAVAKKEEKKQPPKSQLFLNFHKGTSLMVAWNKEEKGDPRLIALNDLNGNVPTAKELAQGELLKIKERLTDGTLVFSPSTQAKVLEAILVAPKDQSIRFRLKSIDGLAITLLTRKLSKVIQTPIEYGGAHYGELHMFSDEHVVDCSGTPTAGGHWHKLGVACADLFEGTVTVMN